MSGYRVPNLEETTSFLVAFWKALFPGSNVGSRFSYHWKRMRAFAGGVMDVHAHVQSAQDDVMPDSAQGAYLTRWGGIVGVPKKSATAARGENALRCYGTPGSVVDGDYLQHLATGFRYRVTEIGTVGVSATYVDVDVAAINTGAATRLLAGETLVFEAPPPGIEANALLVEDLDQDGFDDEQDGSYSVRVNSELAKPRMGGHEDDFVKWLLAMPGVSAAFCYPNRAGAGTVDVTAMHTADGSARAMTDDERAVLLVALKKLAPSGVSGTTGGALRVIKTLPDAKAIEIAITPSGADTYDFDWIDSTPLVVLTYDPTTLTVQFTAPIPGSMRAGHRIVWRGVASAQDGRPFTIETLASASSVILRETPDVDLVATDVGYSGGPLTAIIRDAIIAHVNGEIVYADAGRPTPASIAGTRAIGGQLKPLADGMGTANPAGVYGEWSGALVRAVLGKLASYPAGVRNVDVVLPAADYEAVDPAFPSDDTIYFITAASVLVRRAW